jgi:hypothetical protein
MKHHAHEDVRGNGSIAPSFLTLALIAGEWSASLPVRRGTDWAPERSARCGTDKFPLRDLNLGRLPRDLLLYQLETQWP